MFLPGSEEMKITRDNDEIKITHFIVFDSIYQDAFKM
jgi:hypothetical protein